MTDSVAGRPGNGGETHQEATGEDVRLTTQQGVVVGDDQNTSSRRSSSS